MANEINENFNIVMSRQMFGRRQIYTSVKDINSMNVVRMVQDAMNTHLLNRTDIEYLYNYYLGKQPVLGRVKEIRPEINNKIVENRAAEIVDWKVGYLLSSGVQYVGADGEEADIEKISKLNRFMVAEGIDTKNKELMDWVHICGIGYKLALVSLEDDISPVNIVVPDPRNAFVIKDDTIRHRPIANVYYTVDDAQVTHISVYTRYRYYEIENDLLVREEVNRLGVLPMVEYRLNDSWQGAFENVLSILDAISALDSDRQDGLDQAIQSLLLFINCELPEGETANSVRENGMITLRSTGEMKAELKELVTNLDQSNVQSFKDDLHEAYLTICGMPQRGNGGGSSDNGVAVIYRDGFTDAEARAMNTETLFKYSERQILKVVLRICNSVKRLGLDAEKVEIKFTRRLSDNLLSKTQVLTMLLASEKVAPKLAFQTCGLFSSPDDAWKESDKWLEEQAKKAEEKAKKFANANQNPANAKKNDENEDVNEPTSD